MRKTKQRRTTSPGIPGLSPAQLEALALLSEECGEVVAIIGKALRHGLASTHPDNPDISNREMISREAGQVIASIYIAVGIGVINLPDLDFGIREKWQKVGRYLHHIDIESSIRSSKAKP